MRWLLLVVLAMILAGCEAPSPGAGSAVCGRFSMGIEKTRIAPGDEVGLHVRLENCGSAELAIGARPDCQANALSANVTIQGIEYRIVNGAAQHPIQLSTCPRPSATVETLLPGHVRDLRLMWNGTTNDGAPVAAGNYVIASSFTPLEDPAKTYSATLTIEVT